MKRHILLFIALIITSTASAERITLDFKDVSMSKALKEIEASTHKYTINFIYNELEDFTVTTSIKKEHVTDAVKKIIGFYPIKMTVDSNKIFVECINKSERKFIGRLVDTNNKPVTFANVALLNPIDSTFITGGVSNEAGQIVIPCSVEKVKVRITCMGYRTIYRTMSVDNIGTLRMEPSTYVLKNVTVNGENIIKKDDRTVYMPTKKQINSTNSGIGLLFNLMIPQLHIDRMDNKINTNDGQDVTICIDDRRTNTKEANQLRPRDIARVEFQNYPTTGIYAGDRAVVNFITKKYETGGYVDVRSENRIIYSYGSYDAKLNIDHKKMNYTVLTGTTYDNDRKSGFDLTETYNFASGQILRTQQFLSGKLKKEVNYGLGRVEYKGKTVTLWSEFGFLWTQNPLRRSIYNTTYEPQTLASSVTTNDVYTKSAKPYGDIYFMKKYSNHEMLIADIVYIYTHNNYNRTNVEGSYAPIVNNNKEDYHDVEASIDYSKAFKHQNSIRIAGAEFFKKSIGDYSGTNSSHQNLTSSETLGFASYTQGFGKNLHILGRLGFDYTVYKLNQNKQKTFFNPRANLCINYNVNKISSLSFTTDYGNSYPELSYTSEVTQKVNPLMTLKGNPDLKIVKYLSCNINYDLLLGNFNFNAFSNLLCCIKNPSDQFYENSGNMVHTYTNDCYYYGLQHGIGNTIYMLNKNFTIQTGILFHQTFVTRKNATHLNRFSEYAQLIYMTGKFSFGALYMSKEKDISNIKFFYESNQDYRLWATFSSHGFYAKIGARRPFSSSKDTRQWYNFGKYIYYKKIYSDAEGPYIYVNFSYTFDFGRKIAKNNIEIDRSTNSGMLHP